MFALDILGDPVRRRIMELLAGGELTAGQISACIQEEFGISQPAVSGQLRVLREAGFTSVRPQGTRRLYAINADPLRDVDAWLDRFRHFWAPKLDALATEVARGKRERRSAATTAPPQSNRERSSAATTAPPQSNRERRSAATTAPPHSNSERGSAGTTAPERRRNR